MHVKDLPRPRGVVSCLSRTEPSEASALSTEQRLWPCLLHRCTVMCTKSNLCILKCCSANVTLESVQMHRDKDIGTVGNERRAVPPKASVVCS